MARVMLDYGIGRPEEQAWPPSPDCPERWRWRQVTYQGTEVEVLHWLTATVAMLKPRVVVESGTHNGAGAEALAIGLALCGEGHLWSLECDTDIAAHARRWLAERPYGEYVTVVDGDDLPAMCERLGLRPEFYFCDSYSPETAARVGEIRRMLPHMAPNGIIMAHDTEPMWAEYRAAVQALAVHGLVDAVTLPTPRGLTMIRVRG